MKVKNNEGQAEPTKSKSATHKVQKAVNKRAMAKARRKEAKNWELLARGTRYQKAAVKDSCYRITLQVKEELFDGIFLNLNDHNNSKSSSNQKRILRRIVEKRLAQKAHRQVGRTDDRFGSYILAHCASKSMYDLHRHQTCA